MQDVEEWASRHELTEHIPLLKKGALVAQNPAGAHLIDGPETLEEDELAALNFERDHK
jgi:hypothetical protein